MECNVCDSKTHFLRNCPLPDKFERARAKRKTLFRLRDSKLRSALISSFFAQQADAEEFKDADGSVCESSQEANEAHAAAANFAQDDSVETFGA